MIKEYFVNDINEISVEIIDENEDSQIEITIGLPAENL